MSKKQHTSIACGTRWAKENGEMESEGRLLAIHCDWEHWRRHATQFPTVRTLRRCSSLTLFTDDAEEDEPFDSDFDTEPGDSDNAAASSDEPLGAAGRVTEWYELSPCLFAWCNTSL